MADIGRLIDGGWRPVPLPPGSKGDGAPRGWPSHHFTTRAFLKPCNVAFNLAGLVALDVDIDDPERARRAETIIRALLPPTPFVRRRDKSSRLAIVYRANGPINSTEGPVQVLAAGRMLVAYGTHPKGGAYYWSEDDPQEAVVNSLPAIDQAAVDDVLRAAERALGITSNPARKRGRPPKGTDLIYDGREDFITRRVCAEVGRAKAEGRRLDVNDLTDRVWAIVQEQRVELTRPNRSGRRYDRIFVRKKVVSTVRRAEKIAPMKPGSGWSAEDRAAFKAVIAADATLTRADKAVALALMDCLGRRRVIHATAATIAERTGLHPDTVKACRRRLIALGYFEEITGNRRACVIRPARDLIMQASHEEQATEIVNENSTLGVATKAPPPTPTEAVGALITIAPAWRRECPGFMRRRVEERVGDLLAAGWTVERLAKLDPADGLPIILGPDGRAPSLRIARLAVGLTQIELADLLGISQATVSKLERGKFQPPPMAALIRQILPEAV